VKHLKNVELYFHTLLVGFDRHPTLFDECMEAIKIMPLTQKGCASLMSNVDASKVEIPIAPSFVTKCYKVESCQRLVKNKKCVTKALAQVITDMVTTTLKKKKFWNGECNDNVPKTHR
jgi:dihydroxyacetone kinase-like predicted kinase